MNKNTLRNLALMLAAFGIAASVALAGQVTFPSTFPFTAGTPIRAAEVNGALNAVKSAVDDNHARLGTLEARVAALGDGGLSLPVSSTLSAAAPGTIGLEISAATGKTAIRGTGRAGVVGETSEVGGVGVKASNLSGSAGTALEVAGGLKVSGAMPPAFVHVATAANSSDNFTCIDNPLTNGRPTALVFAIPNFNPSGASGGVYLNSPIGVFYGTLSALPLAFDKWCIFSQNTTTPVPNNAAFNVLVFNQ